MRKESCVKGIQIKNQQSNLFRLLAYAFGFFLMVLFMTGCESQGYDPGVPFALTQDVVIEELPTPTIGIAARSQTHTEASPTTIQSVATEPTATSPAVDMQACSSPVPLTPAQTEGPYYTPGSSERASLLEDDTRGIRLTLSGYVLTSDCQPVAHAWLDFWQADAAGEYDNVGFTLRGHQYTDENGYYQLITVVPGIYPGRTEHIHFKVQVDNGPVLTSQMYFPGVAENQGDGIFDSALVINIVEQSSDSLQATFNIIINP